MADDSSSPSPFSSPCICAIFDFDHSLINTNSDTYIFEVLTPHLLPKFDEFRSTYPVWTDLMHEMLRLVHEAGHSDQEIHQAFENTPHFKEVESVLKLLQELKHHHRDHQNRKHATSSSTSPPSISALTSSSSSSSSCLAPSHVRFIYLGDGSGDFCPSSHLSDKDWVCARRDWALHRLIRQKAAEAAEIKTTDTDAQASIGSAPSSSSASSSIPVVCSSLSSPASSSSSSSSSLSCQCSVVILSDANAHFIASILSHLKWSSYFDAIYTNPSQIDSAGRIHLRYYHSEPHLCKICPRNLCKGEVVRNKIWKGKEGEGENER